MRPTGPRRTDDDPCAAARRMFERVLTGWAMDVLALRRRGLDLPGYRTAEGSWSPHEHPAHHPGWDHAAH